MFWRLDVWNQGVGRDIFSLKPGVHTPSLPFLGLVFVGSSQHSLASRCIILTSASVVIWPSFLTYLHIIFLLFLITLCSCQPLGQNTTQNFTKLRISHWVLSLSLPSILWLQPPLGSSGLCLLLNHLTINISIFFPSTPPQPPSPLTLVLITALSPKALFQTCHSHPHSLYSSTFPELWPYWDCQSTERHPTAPCILTTHLPFLFRLPSE